MTYFTFGHYFIVSLVYGVFRVILAELQINIAQQKETSEAETVEKTTQRKVSNMLLKHISSTMFGSIRILNPPAPH